MTKFDTYPGRPGCCSRRSSTTARRRRHSRSEKYGRWRAILEHLCVENLHVPEIWLPEVRWMLERIAKAARIPGQKGAKAGASTGNTGQLEAYRFQGALRDRAAFMRERATSS